MARRRRGGDFELEARLKGGKETARGFDEIAEAEKRAGRQAENTSKKGERLGGVFQKLTSQASSMVGAFLGIAGVQRVFAALADSMQKAADAARQLNQEGLKARENALLLSRQSGQVGQRGQEVNFEDVVEFARGGAISLPAAEQLAIATDVEFAAVGGLKGPQRKRVLGIGKIIAGFAGSAQLDPDTTGKLVQFLGDTGALGSEKDVAQGLAELQAASEGARTTKLGEFINIGLLGTSQSISAGLSRGKALEITALAKQFALVSPGRAGEGARQILKVAQSTKAAKFFASRGIDNFLDRPLDERFDLLTAAVGEISTLSGSESQAQLEQLIEKDQVSVLRSFLSPAAIAATRASVRGVREAKGETVLRETGEFLASDIAQDRLIGIREAEGAERTARRTAPVERITRLAEARLKRIRAGRHLGDPRTAIFEGDIGTIEEALLSDEAVLDSIRRQIIAERFELLGLPADEVPASSPDFYYGIAEKKLGAASARIARVARERGVRFQAGENGTTVINIGTQVVPNAQVAPERSGQLVPGGAQ